MAVSTSNWVQTMSLSARSSAKCLTRAAVRAKSSSEMSSPSTEKRSLNFRMCGDEYTPTL